MLKSLSNLKVIASYLELAGGKTVDELKKMNQQEQFNYICNNPTSKSVQKITGLSEKEIIKEFGKRAPTGTKLYDAYQKLKVMKNSIFNKNDINLLNNY